MFEKNAQPQNQQPATQPVPEPTALPASGAPPPLPAEEPKDMFADVDQSNPTVMPQQPSGEASAEGSAGYVFEADAEPTRWYMQKRFIILLLGIVLLLIIIIFGVQFATRFLTPSAPFAAPIIPSPTLTEPPETPAPVSPEQFLPVPQEAPSVTTAPTQESAISQPLETPPQAPQDGDTDGDGLTDAEEQAMGTDQTNPDTDGDGLSDREEFRVFGTDPLNPDTDGDGYLDGEEIKNGYNPKGEGKLFTIPTEEKSL